MSSNRKRATTRVPPKWRSSVNEKSIVSNGIHLFSIELPWPPTFVRASLIKDPPSKSVMVNLTWIPNFDGNIPLERYTIQMKDSRASDGHEMSSTYDDLGWQNKEDILLQKNQTKTWTLVRGLRPFTTYRFRLSAWNQLGEGTRRNPSLAVDRVGLTCFQDKSVIRVTILPCQKKVRALGHRD